MLLNVKRFLIIVIASFSKLIIQLCNKLCTKTKKSNVSDYNQVNRDIKTGKYLGQIYMCRVLRNG